MNRAPTTDETHMHRGAIHGARPRHFEIHTIPEGAMNRAPTFPLTFRPETSE